VEFDPLANKFTKKSECPYYGISIYNYTYTLNDKFHVLAANRNNTASIEIISYDPLTKQWGKAYGPASQIKLLKDAFSLDNDKAYITLLNTETKKIEIWEYNPE